MRKMVKNFRMTCFIVIALVATMTLSAQETPVKNAYQYTLDNGLELYVMENHTVPLTYIEIAFKTGAMGQDTKNAGLFHLYEHMMFKGNSQYPTAAAFQRGLKQLGVTSWNGSTGSECVHYFFEIPSDLTQKGLDFWSSAIRDPLLDSDEMANEKKVVISEISGGYKEPSSILGNALGKALFPKYPWRLDPAGSVKNVEDATVEQLREIKNTYYVPNNAALFVGGDVNHDEVYKMVNELYGDWEKAADPWAGERDYQLAVPFDTTQYLVMPYDQVSPQIAQVEVIYRGPDTATDVDSTYAADMIGSISANPNSVVKQTIVKTAEFAVPSPNYVGGLSYYTQKESGQIIIYAVMTSPENSMPQRAQDFENFVQSDIVTNLVNNPDYFKPSEYKLVAQNLKDSDVYAAETADGFLSGLRSLWISTSADYYFTYNDKMNEVDSSDVAAYAKKYLENKPALVVVLVNPSIYEAQKDAFDAAGFLEITEENAYWWKEAKYGMTAVANDDGENND